MSQVGLQWVAMSSNAPGQYSRECYDKLDRIRDENRQVQPVQSGSRVETRVLEATFSMWKCVYEMSDYDFHIAK